MKANNAFIVCLLTDQKGKRKDLLRYPGDNTKGELDITLMVDVVFTMPGIMHFWARMILSPMCWKARLWEKYANASLNERQKLIVNRIAHRH
jgi:hypothetical protein